MTHESLESILRGQVGIVLGILLATILFGMFIKYTLAKFLDRMQAGNMEIIEEIKRQIRATNRLTTVVGTSLISSEIKALRSVGSTAIEEIKMEEVTQK